MRVFVTGGTGLVGRRLVRRLQEKKHDPVVLTRSAASAREKFGDGCTVVEGDPMQAGAWMDEINTCDAIIHLAGENVFAKRWDEAFKTLLRESRIKSTEHIVQALAKKPMTDAGQPKVLVNASAIGFYGPHGDEELNEDAPPGNDFLSQLCVAWEQAAKAAEVQGIRVAIIRVGVVLDKEGGALAKLLTPFKMCVGGPTGSGKQWVSWIHHDDLVGLFLLPLENASASGPLNGTAPQPVTNRDFGYALGRALGRPAVLPTPGFALKLMLGEVSDVILTGQRVFPKKPLGLGFAYKFKTIDEALADILK
ncbi:MAG: TIGR01777 family oxidoreductase [Gemmataceae bacterium]|nr:TIGR01777 family oxidoreductase [Gemmataceae bacterium]